jgi:hypothetical protein
LNYDAWLQNKLPTNKTIAWEKRKFSKNMEFKLKKNRINAAALYPA